MSRASSLYRLQEIDLALDSRRTRLGEVEVALQENLEVQEARAALAAAETERANAQKAAMLAELDVQATVEKHGGVQKLLYGGTVRNPKELQDLQNEAAALLRRRSTLEDRQLEAMILLETADARLGKAQDALAAAEADFATRCSSLLAEKSGLEMEIGNREMEREASEAQVLTEDREVYARLRKSKRGVAVARLSRGACSACGVAPSAQRIASARSQGEVIRCGDCDRILFVDSGPQSSD